MKNLLSRFLCFVAAISLLFLLEGCWGGDCEGAGYGYNRVTPNTYTIVVDSPEQILRASYIGSSLPITSHQTWCAITLSTSVDTTKVVIETLHHTDTLYLVTHLGKPYYSESECYEDHLVVERSAPEAAYYTCDSVHISSGSTQQSNYYPYESHYYFIFHLWP